MPSKIILKKSSVAAKAPVAADLEFGELALNYTDSKLYFKKADGTTIDAFSSSAASGTVTSVGVTPGTGIAVSGSPITTSGNITVTNTAPNVTTDISITTNASNVVVNSSDGTDGTINAATTTLAGVMSSADKTKLDGIAAGATNVTNTNQLTNGAGYITSSGSISGNAATATVLQTARTINGVSFNGSSNITLPASPDATKLPLTGGTMTGIITTVSNGTAINFSGQSDSFGYNGVSGLGTYIKGTGATYLYGGGSFFDGSTSRVLLHAGNYTSYSMPSGSSATNSVDVRAPIFYDSDDTGYYIDPSSYSRIRQLTLTQARVDSSKYPVGHYAPGEEVFAIDPTWTQDQIREYFNSNNVSWVADSTAPGGYAIQLTGAINVGGVYGSGFPYIPVETDDTFYMEVYIKNVTGSNTHYMGSMDFNHNLSNLGGNPGSFGYWVMSNSNPGTGWTKYSGYISGFGTATGQFVAGTKYWTPQALFNYSGGGTSYISGWKVVKLTKGIVGRFPNSTTNTGEAWYGRANDRNRGTYTIQLGGGSSSGRQFEVVDYAWSSVMFKVSSDNFSESAGSSRAPLFYDNNDTGYYIDPNSTSDSALRMRGGALFGPNTSWGASLYVGGNGRVGSEATVAVTNGNLHIDSKNGYQMYLNYYSTEAVWTGGNLGVGSTSASYRLHVHGTGYATSDFRAPIFYDANDTGYYTDQNSTSSYYRINVNNNVLFTNYGRGMIGTYASTVYQAVFAMGDSYKLPDNGSTTGSLYGLAWSHPNAGGTAGNLNTHGLLVLENGGFLAAVSGSIRSRDDMRSPIFYDSNNTGYYVDPNSVSYLYGLTLAGGSYFRPQNWLQFDGSYGLYWPNHYGAHLHANDLSTYTQLALRGSKNSYGGIYDQYSAVNIGMYDSGGNGGVYREANGRWFSYYNVGNDCWGFGTSSTSSAYNLYAPKGIYSGGRVDGTIFYDSNNTGYYLDPTSTTALRTVGSWRADTSGWDGEFAGKIQYHDNSWYLQFSTAMRFRNAGGSDVVTFSNGGAIVASSNVTAFSDERLKCNWQPVVVDFVDRLAQVKSGTYTRTDSGERQAGSSAQDWQKLLPEVVITSNDEDKTLALAYGNAALVSAVELAKRIVEQDARIAKLEERLSKLLGE